jgi:hypothetical protein
VTSTVKDYGGHITRGVDEYLSVYGVDTTITFYLLNVHFDYYANKKYKNYARISKPLYIQNNDNHFNSKELFSF